MILSEVTQATRADLVDLKQLSFWPTCRITSRSKPTEFFPHSQTTSFIAVRNLSHQTFQSQRASRNESKANLWPFDIVERQTSSTARRKWKNQIISILNAGERFAYAR